MGEKRYSVVMIGYSCIAHRRISSTPSYKRSKVKIFDIKVRCIIADWRSFFIHPNKQINILMEKTLLAGLEVVADDDMMGLPALLCITTKQWALIVRRMLEGKRDINVAFKVMDYKPVGSEQRTISKAVNCS